MTMRASNAAGEVTLSPDALVHLGATGGVDVWPAILDLPPTDPTHVVADASDEALGEILAMGLLDAHARPTPWTAATLAVLRTPEAQIDICVHGDSDVHGACLARRGPDHVFAVRSGDAIGLSVPRIADVGDVGRVVGSVFGPAEIPEFVGISVPTNELRERLDRCGCAGDYAASFCAVGATRADAIAMSLAFETCHARAEVVAASTSGGVTHQSSGTVAVYETGHGRIIAEPSISPDGRMWTTIAPGSSERMGRAVSHLLETLPGAGWPP